MWWIKVGKVGVDRLGGVVVGEDVVMSRVEVSGVEGSGGEE